jgi:hypothetical protein
VAGAPGGEWGRDFRFQIGDFSWRGSCEVRGHRCPRLRYGFCFAGLGGGEEFFAGGVLDEDGGGVFVEESKD